jgi:uncharacterized protein YbjT (DUF2867 family)
MTHHILITGATGHVGSGVVTELLDRGVRPRILVRDPERVPEAWLESPTGIDVAVGDFEDPASLDAAMAGVSRVFLTSSDGPDKVAHETAAIDAALRADVDRVVKLSAMHAEAGSPLPAFDWHGRIEGHLATRGVPHVLLRPAFFMENLLMVAAGVALGQLAGPVAGNRVSMVAVADVAASGAAALLAETVRPAYVLTGPAAVTFTEVAAALARAIGRPVDFVDLTPEQARPRFAGAGHPDWLVRQLSGVFGLIRRGGFDHVADGVPVLTGRPATSVAQWALDHAVVFAGPLPAHAG